MDTSPDRRGGRASWRTYVAAGIAAAALAWLMVGPGADGCRDDQVQVGGGAGHEDAPG